MEWTIITWLKDLQTVVGVFLYLIQDLEWKKTPGHAFRLILVIMWLHN